MPLLPAEEEKAPSLPTMCCHVQKSDSYQACDGLTYLMINNN